MVYIVSKNGTPLMPTNRYKHVRELLSLGKAVPICNNPFTIKLKYDTDNVTQELTLGIDVGRENIGLCVSNENGEAVFLAKVQTNNKQVTKNMQERAVHRHARRSHKRHKKQRRAFKTNTTIQNGDDAILRNKKNCKAVSVSYPGMEESVQHKAIKGKEAKYIAEHIVQRDLYAAFLLHHFGDSTTPNYEACQNDCNNFLNQQEKVIAYVKNVGDTTKNFGIRDFK